MAWFDWFIPGKLSSSIQAQLDLEASTAAGREAIKNRSVGQVLVKNFTGAANAVGQGVSSAVSSVANLAGSTVLSFVKPLIPLIIVGVIVAVASTAISKRIKLL